MLSLKIIGLCISGNNVEKHVVSFLGGVGVEMTLLETPDLIT